MKKVKIFGRLSEKYKSEWTLDVKTPSEALRAIDANKPGFISECDSENYVILLVNERDEREITQVTDKNSCDVWDESITLYVFPKINGNIPAIAAAIAGAIATSAIAYAVVYAVVYVVVTVALTLAISAVASLIAGTPDGFGANEVEAPENKPSYLFNGVVNTTRQGHRIPILYGGPILVGSMILSSRIDTKDMIEVNHQ